VITRICRLIEVFVNGGLPISQRSEMNALTRRRRNQPRTDLRFVLDFVQMLEEFDADSLKNVGGISRGETEPNGHGINEPAITRDQRFPCERVSVEARRD